MATRTITVRGVPDGVLRPIRARALEHRRSLNAELLTILERAATQGEADAAPAAVSRRGQVHEPPPQPYGMQAHRSEVRDARFPLTVDRNALADVCRRYHISWLAVFGSRARGDDRRESDVDVAVDFEPGMTPGFGMVAVADALGAVFGGRRVDLVTRRGLGARRDLFLADAVPLYGA